MNWYLSVSFVVTKLKDGACKVPLNKKKKPTKKLGNIIWSPHSLYDPYITISWKIDHGF